MTAQFEFNKTTYYLPLLDVDIYQLREYGIRSMIGKFRKEVWMHLKLKGESVTLREIKYKGLIQQQ